MDVEGSLFIVKRCGSLRRACSFVRSSAGSSAGWLAGLSTPSRLPTCGCRSKAPHYRMIVMNRLNTKNVFEDITGLAEVEVSRDLQLVRRATRTVLQPSLANAARMICKPRGWVRLVAGVLAEPPEPDTRDVVLRSRGALSDQPEHAAVSTPMCLLPCVHSVCRLRAQKLTPIGPCVGSRRTSRSVTWTSTTSHRAPARGGRVLSSSMRRTRRLQRL